MCGRFVYFRQLEEWMRYFPIHTVQGSLTPNYNVAPSQKVFALVRHGNRNHLDSLHWGLVPFWAKDTTIGNRMINARSETAAAKPSFRTALQWRRCLILADGFYEWKRVKPHRQPMFLTLPDGRPMAFAGLWESWDNRGKAAQPYRSCTILTTAAGPSVLPIHHRMPVILQPQAFEAWLSRDTREVRLLQHILQHQIHTELKSVPVSRQVNSVRNNRPENIQPVAAGQ